MQIENLRCGIKFHTADGRDKVIFRPYDEISEREGHFEGKLSLLDEAGKFVFFDKITPVGEGFSVECSCLVEKLAPFVTGIGLSAGATLAEAYGDLQFFMPSAWYGEKRFFEGKSNKFPMIDGVAGGGVDGIGAPVCAAFSLKNKLAYSVEAEDPGYDAPLPKTGDVVIDGRITLPGIGFSKGEELALVYQFPATSYHIAGEKRTIFYYLPAEEGMRIEGRFCVRAFPCESYHGCLKKVWRDAYDKYAVINENVDTSTARKALLRYIAGSYGVVNGIPQYMTNVDHFTHESGFLYRNADLALLMLEYGEKEGRKDIVDDALSVLTSQVEKEYAGGNQVFEFERSRAEGVHCILKAYRYLKKRGDEKREWLAFAEREAKHFLNTEEYFSVPLLCDLGIIKAAEEKAEKIWKKFSDMNFYGGVVDFLAEPVLDRESGYIGLYDFLTLYECTREAKWIERAAFCADYLETYQVLRIDGYAALDIDGNEHFNMAAIGNETLRCNGLSYISANCNGTDVFNVLAVPLYYKLSILTGDKHYFDYAKLLERNALEYIDLNNKAGALCDVMYGTGIGFMNEYYQLAVSDDSAGPYTGTAHDANIAWMPFAVLSSQRDIAALTGKPFLSENKRKEMRQNFSFECDFSGREERKIDLTCGDFYRRTHFSAGERLEIVLPREADEIVFAHGEKYIVYRYKLEFFGDKEQLKEVFSDKCARFTSFSVPSGCDKIVMICESPVVLRQIQIFGEAPTENIFRKPKRPKEGLYLNGADYSSLQESLAPWSYFAKADGEYISLVYDDVKNAWRFEGDEYLCVKSGCLVHPGASVSAVTVFTAPKSGIYAVRRYLSPAQYLDRFGAEVVCSVYREDNLIEERVFKLEREASEEVRFETLLEEGEKLYFEVAAKNGNSHCFLSDEIELRIER